MATRLGDVTLPVKEVLAANPSFAREDLGPLQDLKASMSRNGLVVPILLTRHREVIDGARRLVAADQLGWDVINVVVTEDWKRIKDHLVHTRAVEKDGWPHLDMAPWDINQLIEGLLKRLYAPKKAADAAHSRHVNDRRRARGESVVRHQDAGGYQRRTALAVDCAEMFGVELSVLVTWRDIFSAYKNVLKKNPQAKDEAESLITKAHDHGWRLHSVLATLRAWARGEPAGNRRFEVGITQQTSGVLPRADSSVAKQQAAKIERMIDMLETMAGEVKAMTYLNPALDVDTADVLSKRFRPVLRDVGKLRGNLDAHIQRAKTERE